MICEFYQEPFPATWATNFLSCNVRRNFVNPLIFSGISFNPLDSIPYCKIVASPVTKLLNGSFNNPEIQFARVQSSVSNECLCSSTSDITAERCWGLLQSSSMNWVQQCNWRDLLSLIQLKQHWTFIHTFRKSTATWWSQLQRMKEYSKIKRIIFMETRVCEWVEFVIVERF